jgi:hypothetical protein
VITRTGLAAASRRIAATAAPVEPVPLEESCLDGVGVDDAHERHVGPFGKEGVALDFGAEFTPVRRNLIDEQSALRIADVQDRHFANAGFERQRMA